MAAIQDVSAPEEVDTVPQCTPQEPVGIGKLPAVTKRANFVPESPTKHERARMKGPTVELHHVEHGALAFEPSVALRRDGDAASGAVGHRVKRVESGMN